LGYHVQSGNADRFLSLDFGLRAFAEVGDAERLRLYRKFVYRVGSLPSGNGAGIDAEEQASFHIGTIDRFRYRTRYFTDSGVIGTKEFVARCAQRFKSHFESKNQKTAQAHRGARGRLLPQEGSMPDCVGVME
jgi:hypothetical protein